jgi:hypothetical protein
MRDRILIACVLLALVVGVWFPVLHQSAPEPLHKRMGAVLDQPSSPNAWVEGVVNGYPVAVNVQALDGGAAGTQQVLSVGSAHGFQCSGTTYADAGGGIAVALLDAGTVQFGCNIANLSSNTVSIFASCSSAVTATGSTQGREIPAGQNAWFPSTCLPYVASASASQAFTCECYGQ